MATSSIFANVHITTPEAAERFVRALELSEKDPPIKTPTDTEFITDRAEINRILEKWGAEARATK